MGSHQTLNLPASWSWTSSPQNCEKSMSVVSESPSLRYSVWVFCYSGLNGQDSPPVVLVMRSRNNSSLWWLINHQGAQPAIKVRLIEEYDCPINPWGKWQKESSHVCHWLIYISGHSLIIFQDHQKALQPTFFSSLGWVQLQAGQKNLGRAPLASRLHRTEKKAPVWDHFSSHHWFLLAPSSQMQQPLEVIILRKH